MNNDKQIWNIDIVMPDGEIMCLEWHTSFSASEICKHFEDKNVEILKLERAAHVLNTSALIKPKKILTKGDLIK